MSPTTGAPRITVVGPRPAALAGHAVTDRPADVETPVDEAEVVVVGGTDEDQLVVLQRLRAAGVACPVVVVCGDPDALAARASLVPLLPRDVAWAREDDLSQAVTAGVARHRTRRRDRATVAAVNQQLAELPRLPVVRSLQLLDELVAFSPIGVLVLEAARTIALANGAAAALLAADVQALVGQTVDSVAPVLVPHLAGGGAGPAAGGPAAPVEVELGERTVELRHWRVEGGVPATVVLLDDVTYRHEAEAVLAEAFAQEREVASNLREVVAIKDSLLSSISHEMRTPVAVAKGMAETLLDHGDMLTPAQSSDFLERIHGNARRLERLIESLLDLDRLRRGMLEPDVAEVDVLETVSGAVEESRVRGRQLTVEVTPEARVAEVDAMWLERIIVNLLTNAVRYTPRGSPLELTVDRHDGALRVRAVDHGPGVPDELKETLFESFRQGVRGSAAGVGIGLSLVRQFAELHGGAAHVRDTPGGGATFVVLLGTPVVGDGG